LNKVYLERDVDTFKVLYRMLVAAPKRGSIKIKHKSREKEKSLKNFLEA